MLETLRNNIGGLAGAIALLALSTQSPSMAQTGFVSEPSGLLEQVNLSTAGIRVLSDLGLSTKALAWSPGGELFIASSESVSNPAAEGAEFQAILHVFDLENRTLEIIGNLSDVEEVSDLALDEEGDLWMIADGMLFSVNPETAAMEIVGGSELKSLAVWKGQLWGLQRGKLTWDLVVVDATNGDATVVGPVFPIFIGLRSMSMDFDNEGNLWILEWQSPVIPIGPTARVHRLDGLDIGTLVEMFEFDDIRDGLAISRARDVVEIPTLGNSGRVLLILLLVVGALTILRRRL